MISAGDAAIRVSRAERDPGAGVPGEPRRERPLEGGADVGRA
jgi:hypothetical protein